MGDACWGQGVGGEVGEKKIVCLWFLGAVGACQGPRDYSSGYCASDQIKMGEGWASIGMLVARKTAF